MATYIYTYTNKQPQTHSATNSTKRKNQCGRENHDRHRRHNLADCRPSARRQCGPKSRALAKDRAVRAVLARVRMQSRSRQPPPLHALSPTSTSARTLRQQLGGNWVGRGRGTVESVRFQRVVRIVSQPAAASPYCLLPLHPLHTRRAVLGAVVRGGVRVEIHRHAETYAHNTTKHTTLWIRWRERAHTRLHCQ